MILICLHFMVILMQLPWLLPIWGLSFGKFYCIMSPVMFSFGNPCRISEGWMHVNKVNKVWFLLAAIASVAAMGAPGALEMRVYWVLLLVISLGLEWSLRLMVTQGWKKRLGETVPLAWGGILLGVFWPAGGLVCLLCYLLHRMWVMWVGSTWTG